MEKESEYKAKVSTRKKITGEERKTRMAKAEGFAITVTFSKLLARTPNGMFKETIPELSRVLWLSTDFLIWPEWRLATGDIHYHGVVYIYDKIKWHKSTLPALKRFGFFKIKPIDNYDKWIKYCTKEEQIATDIIDVKLPIETNIKLVASKKKGPKHWTISDWYENIEKDAKEVLPEKKEDETSDKVRSEKNDQ